MILFRHLLPILAALLLSPAFGAVTLSESTQVTLLRGTTTVGTYASWDDCLARARELANASTATTGSVTYTCQTERRRVTANYSANPPPPAPVDCAVSDWSAWSAGAWGQCSAGSQSRIETRSRTVTVPAANGGAACPVLTESRAVSQPCTVDPPPPPPPTASSYPWYPALDLSQIPWHNAAGPWGPAVRLQAPAAPNLTGAVVNLTGEGAAQNLYNPPPGTRYVVAANVGTVSLGGTVTDVELVIPPGFRIGLLDLTGTINRVRVRGTTIGTHSGGQVLRVGINSQSAQDIIFDGIKIASTNEAFADSIVVTGRPNRVAIVNCKIRSPRITFTGQGLNFVWAGNSIQSGVISAGQAIGATGVGDAQWTIRHGTEGPVVLFGNDIRGRKYHRFRTGANTAAEAATTLHYIAKNTIVDEQESAITLVLGATSSPATIITENSIHAYNAGGGARFDAEMARYARITGNRFYSNSITAAWLAGRAATHVARLPGADVDYTTGNTFAPWSRPAAWGGAGDPSDVYLAPAPILNQAWHDADLVGIAP